MAATVGIFFKKHPRPLIAVLLLQFLQLQDLNPSRSQENALALPTPSHNWDNHNKRKNTNLDCI